MGQVEIPEWESRLAYLLVKGGIIGLPLVWVLGLGVIFYHIIAAALFGLFVIRASRRPLIYKPDFCLWPLLGYCFCYMLSILLAVNSADGSRLIAALYNLSYWIMALMIIVAVANLLSYRDICRLYQSLYWPMCLLGGGALLAIWLWLGGQEYWLPRSILGSVLGETGIPMLDDSLTLEVLRKDWLFGSAWPRTSVMAPYPNALAAMCVLMTGAYFSVKGKLALTDSIPLVLVAVAFAMSWSRSSFALVAMLIMMIFVLRRGLILTFLSAAAFLVFMVMFFDFSVLDGAYSARSNSSENRVAMYIYGIESLSGHEWLFGKGVKERLSYFKFPIGSHSTLIGALIKAGLIGLIFLTTFILLLVVRSFLGALQRGFSDVPANVFFIVMFYMAGWMLFEDLDSPQFVMFLFALIVAGDILRRYEERLALFSAR